jgi:hypothetical protein
MTRGAEAWSVSPAILSSARICGDDRRTVRLAGGRRAGLVAGMIWAVVDWLNAHGPWLLVAAGGVVLAWLVRGHEPAGPPGEEERDEADGRAAP